MVRLISRQRGGLAALKLTQLFGIDNFPAAKDSGKVLIIIIYCYLIIIVIIIIIIIISTIKIHFVPTTHSFIEMLRTLTLQKDKGKMPFPELFVSNSLKPLFYNIV